MGTGRTFVSRVVATVLGGMIAITAVGQAASFHFDIENEPLSQALRDYGQVSGQEIIFTDDLVSGAKPASLKGEFTAKAALDKLLKGTGLIVERSPSGALMIRRAPSNPSVTRSEDDSTVKNDQAIAEIIVTAQKRSERLQDVPVPVTVLNADALADTGKVLLKDYFTSIPGLALSPSILAQTNLAIRGITTSGFSAPTVGLMVDDVPFGATESTDVPDIDPGDLARVEVLRGPQGTLYGASSMGGLIKFVTKDPSTEGFSGRVEGGTEGVKHGAEPGFNLRGSVNVPVSDTIAIRASVFTRQDAGYIDNNAISGYQKGVDEAQAYGGRLAAMWRPSENLVVKLSALYQRTHADGGPEVDLRPGLGELQQDRLPDTGGYDRRVQAYSAVIDYKIGRFDLTSVTGYNVDRSGDALDYTAALGGSLAGLPGYQNGDGVKYVNEFDIAKFSQELRLSTSVGSFDFLAGVFYSRESSAGSSTTIYAVDSLTGTNINAAGGNYVVNPDVLWQRAVFGDLTYHFTDRFDVQIGGRYSKYTENGGSQYYYGVFNGIEGSTAQAGGLVVDGLDQRGQASTYLFTPRFRVSDDLMVYARLASGYRPGAPNSFDRIKLGAPASSSPDKTETYEVGLKADFLDHKLSVDTSLYYTNWKNIQITLLVDGLSYLTNGSGAKSEGVELSVTAKPLTGLAITGWVDYDKAVLTKDFGVNSPSYGAVGDRLPLSAQVTANLSLEQDVRLGNELIGFAGADMSYVGNRYGQFLGFADAANTVPTPRQYYPSYTKLDLSAGVKHEQWKISVYLRNVADKRGILNGGPGDLYNPYAFLYIQPRTLGLSLSRSF